MYEVKGLPSIATSTRFAASFGVTVTAAPPVTIAVPARTNTMAFSMMRRDFILRRRSEHHPYRSLHDARRPRADDLSEPRVHLIALRVEAGRRIHAVELRVVEQVVDLPPQLDPAI